MSRFRSDRFLSIHSAGMWDVPRHCFEKENHRASFCIVPQNTTRLPVWFYCYERSILKLIPKMLSEVCVTNLLNPEGKLSFPRKRLSNTITTGTVVPIPLLRNRTNRNSPFACVQYTFTLCEKNIRVNHLPPCSRSINKPKKKKKSTFQSPRRNLRTHETRNEIRTFSLRRSHRELTLSVERLRGCQ